MPSKFSATVVVVLVWINLQAWRPGVREVLDLAARNHEGPVFVPMTLIDSGYFTQIVGGLREDGHGVRHFALLAERATVLRRLSRRGSGYGLKREQWVLLPGRARSGNMRCASLAAR